MGSGSYHTPGGLRRVLATAADARSAFRRFIHTVDKDFQCSPFAYHPLGSTLFDKPVVGSFYAPALPLQPNGAPERICTVSAATKAVVTGVMWGSGGDGVASQAGVTSVTAVTALPVSQPGVVARAVVAGEGDEVDNCACGFLRYTGVDNAAAQQVKPALVLGLAEVELRRI